VRFVGVAPRVGVQSLFFRGALQQRVSEEERLGLGDLGRGENRVGPGQLASAFVLFFFFFTEQA
jgi:hypothetical protein